jgi:hypothetical protein
MLPIIHSINHHLDSFEKPYKQLELVSHRDIQTLENNVWKPRVFIHCFLVFGYPGETLALVVHILHIRLYLIRHYTTLYNIIQNYTTLYKAIRHYTTLYNVIQDYITIYKGYTTLYNTIQRYTRLCNNIYKVIQHYTTLYKTIKIMTLDKIIHDTILH